MRIRLALLFPAMALAACDQLPAAPDAPVAPAAEAATPAPARVAAPVLTAGKAGGAPLSRPAAARPEAYDQSTATEKAAAAAPAAAARRLGETVASLGNPTEQGFWIKTPLVRAAGKGRLVDPASGKSVNVDLIPLAGPESGGSQVSLAALQMLGVPLTGLPKLEVFAR